MHVAIASDHRGFQLKKELIQQYFDLTDPVIWDDLGPDHYQPDDDYIDYAVKLVEYLKSHPEIEKGVLLCGAGVGMSIVANRFIGIRCGLAISPLQVAKARSDDDINVLAIGSEYVSVNNARIMVEQFLKTPFSGLERYKNRLDKLRILEEGTNG